MCKKTTLRPVRQRDGWSCGYCALASVYSALGLPIKDLRERLGVDRVLPRFPGSGLLDELIVEQSGDDLLGTLPSTMASVLAEDGFDAWPTSSRGRFVEGVRESGLPGLFLGRHVSHWLAVERLIGAGVVVVNSLPPSKKTLRPEVFARMFNTGFVLRSLDRGRRAPRPDPLESIALAGVGWLKSWL